MLHAAFPAKPQRHAGAWLQAGVADVADPEAARRLAGDAEAGVTQTVIPGWSEGPDPESRGSQGRNCAPSSLLSHRPGMTARLSRTRIEWLAERELALRLLRPLWTRRNGGRQHGIE